MTHARSDRRRNAASLAPAVALLAVMAAPAAHAAETGATTATATFAPASCTGTNHTVQLSVKNPSPSSATFTIRVDGPHVASPNTVTVAASSTNGAQLTLPNDATKATVLDSTGNVVGSTSIPCATSSPSSTTAGSSTSDTATSAAGASSAASGGSGSSSSAPSATSSTTAPVSAPSASTDGGTSDSKKYLGIGLAGLGIVVAGVLLFREFK